MSNPQPLFSVTLTAADVQSLRDLLEKSAEEWGPWSGDARILDALDAAKPVRATKPRAPRPAAEPFSPNTGNAAVDEFMRRKHNPKWKPLPLPKSPGLPPLRPMKVSEFDAAEAAWKKACNEARERVASGNPSEAERGLRDLIAIHRNPWRLEATERPDSRTETRISRAPGIRAWRFTRSASADPSGAASPTRRHGTSSPAASSPKKVHYAVEAAELEADALA